MRMIKKEMRRLRTDIGDGEVKVEDADEGDKVRGNGDQRPHSADNRVGTRRPTQREETSAVAQPLKGTTVQVMIGDYGFGVWRGDRE